MPYIDIDGYEDVEIEFTNNNIEEIIKKVKRINEKSENHYKQEDIDALEKSLKFLGNILTKFSLEAYITSVYIDETDFKDLTHGGYDAGYDDAIERQESINKYITQNYGCLLQKIERLAYGYGNQDPLTREEIEKIRNILHDKLIAW